MNLEPEGIKVLVLPEAVEEMTAGGICTARSKGRQRTREHPWYGSRHRPPRRVRVRGRRQS